MSRIATREELERENEQAHACIRAMTEHITEVERERDEFARKLSLVMDRRVS